MFFAEFV